MSVCSHHHVLGPDPLSRGFHIPSRSRTFPAQSGFQPNRGPVSETSNQKETIASVSKSWALILSMADISQVPFLKSVYLSYSNKNTSLKFSRKNLSCYAVRHCISDWTNLGGVYIIICICQLRIYSGSRSIIACSTRPLLGPTKAPS